MNTYNDYLNDCTKKELVTIAKFHHMTGYSILKKEELAEKLTEYLKNEDNISLFFSCLDREELEFCSSKKSTSDPFLARRLVNGGFCFLTENGRYEVPSDFPTEFFIKPEFVSLQKKNSTLTNILNMSGMLYGCIHVSVLCDLYKKYTKQILSEAEMEESIRRIPESFNDMIFLDGLYVKHDFMENNLYVMIQKCQDKLPYYMPDYDTMIHLVRYGYFRDEYTDAFSDYMGKHPDLSAYEVRNVVIRVQAIFRQGGTLAEVGQFLRDEDLLDGRMPEKEMMELLNTMFAHSRLLLNRGFTESEKTARNKTFVTKIYPNSPCPCGSGKKYKKCCGRR